MNNETRLPAVVLAGGDADPEIRARYSVAYRAEMPIAGKMMAQHVTDALKASSHVGDILVVGNIRCEGVAGTVPSADSMIENLLAGVKACGSEGRILVATSDIPMLTTEAVDDFIVRCADLDADFCYPIISRESSEKRFPGVRRTYVRLAEGTFTGGNIMVVRSQFLTDHADLIRQVMDARKDKMRLARLIGIGTLVRTVIAQKVWAGAIDLAMLERTVGRIMQAKLKAVTTPYPEIGADVDDAEQAAFAERELRG